MNIEIKNYKIKATPKDGSEPYFVHNGLVYTDKDKAETEAKSCNEYWGEKITFEVVDNE